MNISETGTTAAQDQFLKRHPAVVAISHGEHYTLIHPENGRRLRLSPLEYSWWEAIAQTHTLHQLLQLAYKNNGRFALPELHLFIDNLKRNGFLASNPVPSIPQPPQSWPANKPLSLISSFTPLLKPLWWRPIQYLIIAITLLGTGLFLSQLPSLTSMPLAWATKSEWLALLLGILLIPFVQLFFQTALFHHYEIPIPYFQIRLNGITPILSLKTVPLDWLPKRQQIICALNPLLSSWVIASSLFLIEAVIFLLGFGPTPIGLLSLASWFYLLLELSPWLDSSLTRSWKIAVDRPFLPQQTFPAIRKYFKQPLLISSVYRQFGIYTLLYATALFFLLKLLWQGQLRPWLSSLSAAAGIAARLPSTIFLTLFLLPIFYWLTLRLKETIQSHFRKYPPSVWWKIEPVTLWLGILIAFLIRYLLLNSATELISGTAVLYILCLATQLHWFTQYRHTYFPIASSTFALATLGLLLAHPSPYPLAPLFLLTASLSLFVTAILYAQQHFSLTHFFDKLAVTLILLLGLCQLWLMSQFPQNAQPLSPWLWGVTLFLIIGTQFLLIPTLFNFSRTRYFFPWLLQFIAISAIPWLNFLPGFHFWVATLWLFSTVLLSIMYLTNQSETEKATPLAVANKKITRLSQSITLFQNNILQQFEPLSGRRPLTKIRTQLETIPLPDDTMLNLSNSGRLRILLLVDRLQKNYTPEAVIAAGKIALNQLALAEAKMIADYLLIHTKWGQSWGEQFRARATQQQIAVRHIPDFSPLPTSFLERLWTHLRPKTVRAGVMLAQQDEDASKFFLIEKGSVLAYRPNHLPVRLYPGDYFGVTSLQPKNSAYEATYEAETNCDLLILDRHMFKSLRQTDALITRPFLQAQKERAMIANLHLLADWLPNHRANLYQVMETATLDIQQSISPNGRWSILLDGQLEKTTPPLQSLHPGYHFGLDSLLSTENNEELYTARTVATLWLLTQNGLKQLDILGHKHDSPPSPPHHIPEPTPLTV